MAGVSNGDQSLELVRHVFADMDSTVQEDVLVLDFLGLPLWKKEETVICLAKELVAQLNIRYCLAVERLVPPPAEKTSTQWLEGKFLWPNTPGAPESAIRWLYLAGTGWISPTELKRRYPAPEQTCRYPLITRYRVDGVASDGIFVPLDLSHWEYKLLEHRTQERLDHKKFEGGKQL